MRRSRQREQSNTFQVASNMIAQTLGFPFAQIACSRRAAVGASKHRCQIGYLVQGKLSFMTLRHVTLELLLCLAYVVAFNVAVPFTAVLLSLMQVPCVSAGEEMVLETATGECADVRFEIA